MKLKIFSLFCYHVLFFILFYELRVSLESQSLEVLTAWFKLEDGLLNLSSLFVFFGFAAGSYLILFYYYQKSIFKVIIGVIAVFFLVIGVRYFLEEIFFLKVFGFDNFYDGIQPLVYVLRNLFYAVLHIVFGFIFFFIQYSIHQEKQAQALLIENKQTELAFLRAQVNPHFLFNTLNNIYSLVYQKSDKALFSLEKLTAILRYSLYQNVDKISLEKEIEMIENFIALERIRYPYPLTIDFEITGDLSTFRIPPLLLLPIVENAFKHGDMRLPLDIKLETTTQQFDFSVKNHIRPKQKDSLGGIGLKNIKNRLELIYEKDYTLKINERDAVFEVILNIKF